MIILSTSLGIMLGFASLFFCGTSFAAEAASVTQAEDSLKNSAEAAEHWLQFIDKKKYAESWDASALTLKLKISKSHWITLMDKIRKPYGSLISRKLADQKTAIDPANLPKGNYMVIVFRSSFSQKDQANELVTLMQEHDKKWRILTYQIQ